MLKMILGFSVSCVVIVLALKALQWLVEGED